MLIIYSLFDFKVFHLFFYKKFSTFWVMSMATIGKAPMKVHHGPMFDPKAKRKENKSLGGPCLCDSMWTVKQPIWSCLLELGHVLLFLSTFFSFWWRPFLSTLNTKKNFEKWKLQFTPINAPFQYRGRIKMTNIKSEWRACAILCLELKGCGCVVSMLMQHIATQVC